MSYDMKCNYYEKGNTGVSIPLEQGNVLRLLYHRNLYFTRHCLNPFGTGQCLTTLKGELQKYTDQSQSLWNRAMSYDSKVASIEEVEGCLNPFGTGQCLTTL